MYANACIAAATAACGSAGVAYRGSRYTSVASRAWAMMSSLQRATVQHASFSTAPIPGDHMREGLGLPASAKAISFTQPFTFECGDEIRELTLAYSTYGNLNADGTNAVIVGHSLTSNSSVHEWWGPLLGDGPQYALDTSRYFIICCNYLGSVYGSSGPLDIDTRTGNRFGSAFPISTLQDNVRAQRLLLDALGVRRLAFAMGGSLGGMLAMEWAALHPEFVDQLLLVACPATHSDWAIGWGEVGRQAIYADPKWRGGDYPLADPPVAGMNVARQTAMLSYRTPFSFTDKFKRTQKVDGRTAQQMLHQGQGRTRAASTAVGAASLVPAPYFEVEGYLNYQGEKFVRRFDPLSYVRLTQLLDSHDIGRGRGGDYRAVLAGMKQRTLVAGIDSDLLYPLDLQREMACLLPNASLLILNTPHGHDGFLIEIDALNAACVAWLAGMEHKGVVKGSSLRQQEAARTSVPSSQTSSSGGTDRSRVKIKLG